MNRRMMTRLCLWTVSIITVAPGALGQDRQSPADTKLKVIDLSPQKRYDAKTLAKIKRQAAAGATIPLWNYSIVAYDGSTYQGIMVGRSPFFHGHRVTTIPTFIVPLIFTFADTGTVFDPTVADTCIGGQTVVSLIQSSPLFETTDFIMNGVDVGNTQYLDAFRRANFWKDVGGTPYHTVFSTTPTVLAGVPISVPATVGQTVTPSGTPCRTVGTIDKASLDSFIQGTLIPQLAAQGVGPTSFPQFLSDSVFETTPGSAGVALGYHDAFTDASGNFQTYSVNTYDTSGATMSSTGVMSHEIGEWMDDPTIGNPVPAWGAEGQQPNCQTNLEVGDPLSPGFSTPTNPYTVTLGANTYTLQELTFFSWFYGPGPSLGAGGLYSDNGTFKGFAKACPPGGTN